MNDYILKQSYELYSEHINNKKKTSSKMVGKLSYNYFKNHIYMFDKYVNKAININRLNKIKKII